MLLGEGLFQGTALVFPESRFGGRAVHRPFMIALVRYIPFLAAYRAVVFFFQERLYIFCIHKLAFIVSVPASALSAASPPFFPGIERMVVSKTAAGGRSDKLI
jgi:hypothetical protein